MTRPGLTQERLIALFLLGVLLFTPPFLGIFNTPGRVLGMPILYVYLFGAWMLLILLVALAIEGTEPADDSAGAAESPPNGAEATNGETRH